MKVNVEIDATPEELRRFLGLPDVQPLQEEMVELIRQRMHAGTEGYDPLSLMTPFLPDQFRNMESLQRQFWDAFYRGGADASAGGDAPGGRGGKKKSGK